MSELQFTPDVRFEPWWREAAPPSTPSLEPLPARIDVAVIGAGFTGLSAALSLARAGRGVLVLEAGDPGNGGSVRNGGMVGSGHRVGFGELAPKYGRQAAIDILKEGMASLDFTTGLIERENIDCQWVRSGRFRAAWRSTDYETLAREMEEVRGLIGLDADMVPRSEQHREVVTDSYHGGCVYHAHGALHPGLFHQGLLDRAREAGAQVAGDTPVTAITKNGPGNGKNVTIATPRGAIEARDVIVATNAYTGPATPRLRRRIVPVGSYVIATEPLDPGVVDGIIPNRRMIVETRFRHCYYRPSPDGRRIIFGGRAALRMIGETASAAVLRSLMVGLFPALADVKISHSWSGSVGFTRQTLPHIGGHDHIFHAMGYCGSGVAMAPYLGHKAAMKVLGSDEGRTAFDGLPFSAVPFYTGTPWFLPFLDAYYSYKDRLQGSQ